MHHPTDRIAHTTGFVTPVVEHWLERGNIQYKTIQYITSSSGGGSSSSTSSSKSSSVDRLFFRCVCVGGGGGA